MSDMADVLRDHRILQDVWPPRCFTCGDVTERTEADHKAAALSAAGFGPVEAARAEAWDEGRAAGSGLIAESTDGGNNYTFRRGTNPYRTEASS